MMQGFFGHSGFAMKGQKQQSERIKGGDKDTGQHGKVGIPGARDMTVVHSFNDRIFRKEPGKGWNTGQRERADDCGRIGDRHD